MKAIASDSANRPQTLGISFTPIRPAGKSIDFGAIVSGVDSVSDLSSTAFEIVRSGLYEHQVLVFKGQGHLTPAQFAAFVKRFDPGAPVLRGDPDRPDASIWRDQRNNPWEKSKAQLGPLGDLQLPGVPEVLVIGQGPVRDHHSVTGHLGGKRPNYGGSLANSQVVGGGQLQWHIDGAFYQTLPPFVTSMQCIEAPETPEVMCRYDGQQVTFPAGATAFASAYAAYDALAPDEKRWAKTVMVHYGAEPFKRVFGLPMTENGLRVIDDGRDYSEHFKRAETDPGCMSHPLVWTHPVTGRAALQAHTRCMLCLEAGGVRLGVVESRLLIEKLMAPAIAAPRVYGHGYEEGDLVIWDNLSMWHSATGGLKPTDRRVMHLVSFNGSHEPLCRLG